MTQAEMADVMERVFVRCRAMRNAGQQEYAHRGENAFANFARVGESLGLSQERVLMVYLLKHIDGISSYTQGHRSQREDVRGRIHDAITYLCLLYGMIDEADGIRHGPVWDADGIIWGSLSGGSA
jgi:hypothetical protein